MPFNIPREVSFGDWAHVWRIITGQSDPTGVPFDFGPFAPWANIDFNRADENPDSAVRDSLEEAGITASDATIRKLADTLPLRDGTAFFRILEEETDAEPIDKSDLRKVGFSEEQVADLPDRPTPSTEAPPPETGPPPADDPGREIPPPDGNQGGTGDQSLAEERERLEDIIQAQGGVTEQITEESLDDWINESDPAAKQRKALDILALAGITGGGALAVAALLSGGEDGGQIDDGGGIDGDGDTPPPPDLPPPGDGDTPAPPTLPPTGDGNNLTVEQITAILSAGITPLLGSIFGPDSPIVEILGNLGATPDQTAIAANQSEQNQNQEQTTNIFGQLGAGANAFLNSPFGGLLGLILPSVLAGDAEGRDLQEEVTNVLDVIKESGVEFTEQELAQLETSLLGTEDQQGRLDILTEFITPALIDATSQIRQGNVDDLTNLGGDFLAGLDPTGNLGQAQQDLLGIDELEAPVIEASPILQRLQSDALTGLDTARDLGPLGTAEIQNASRAASQARHGGLSRSHRTVLDEVLADYRERDRREDRARGFALSTEPFQQNIDTQNAANFLNTAGINRNFAVNKANLIGNQTINPLLNGLLGVGTSPQGAQGFLNNTPQSFLGPFGQGFFNDIGNTNAGANLFNTGNQNDLFSQAINQLFFPKKGP